MGRTLMYSFFTEDSSKNTTSGEPSQLQCSSGQRNAIVKYLFGLSQQLQVSILTTSLIDDSLKKLDRFSIEHNVRRGG